MVILDGNLNWELMLGYKSCTYVVHRCLWYGIIFHYEHNYQEKKREGQSIFSSTPNHSLWLPHLFEFQLLKQMFRAQY